MAVPMEFPKGCHIFPPEEPWSQVKGVARGTAVQPEVAGVLGLIEGFDERTFTETLPCLPPEEHTTVLEWLQAQLDFGFLVAS